MTAAADRLEGLVDAVRAVTTGRSSLGVSHDDADATVGTIATDDALGFDPRPVLAALAGAGARVVVIGQVAGVLHGSAEVTGDLDLAWSGRRADADALARGLEAAGAALTDGDGRPLDRSAAALAARAKALFRTPTAAGDLCTPALPWGGLDLAAMLERAEAVDAGGYDVHVLRRDDLIAMRRALGRPKDLRRAEELERLGDD